MRLHGIQKDIGVILALVGIPLATIIALIALALFAASFSNLTR